MSLQCDTFFEKGDKNMSRIPISVCIIAKNEAVHIEECLKRLRQYDLEIVVADTGSTDCTREIATQYADKVVSFSWCDDFSAARNFCAKHASNSYILALDCDEYIEKCNTTGLMRQVRANQGIVGTINIQSIVSRPDGQYSRMKDNIPRFYDKRYYAFKGAVHEQIMSRKGKGGVPAYYFGLPIEVTHYGYALSSEQMRVKQERNLHLLHHALEIEGESAYLYFQLGQSELVLNNSGAAVQYYEKGLDLVDNCQPLYVHNMVEGLAKAYVMEGRAEDALALMERYEPLCDSARFVFYHANVLMDNHEPLKALIKYVKATMMPDTDMLGSALLYCYQHIIELYHLFGEDDLADVFCKKYEECQKNLYTE